MWIASAITLMEQDAAKQAQAVTRQAVEPVAAPVVEPPAIKTRRVVAHAAAKNVAPVEEAEAPKLVMTRTARPRGGRYDAARNTQVPFILLKHRVLTEHRSLADAIRASMPDLDAEAEVKRARSAAKSDLAALSAAN